MLNRVTFAMNLATALILSVTAAYLLVAPVGMLPAPARWGLALLVWSGALVRVAALMRGGEQQRETLIR
jgi:hypothetical protein